VRKIKSARKVPRKKLKLLFSALIILALLDLIATILWLSLGAAEEANPLMEYLVQESMVTFAFGKLLLTFFGIGILKWLRPKRPNLVLSATWTLVLIYIVINIWHLIGFLWGVV